MAQLIARVVWDHQAAGLSPVAPTILGFGICFPKPFSLFSAIHFLRADDCFRQPSALIIIRCFSSLLTALI